MDFQIFDNWIHCYADWFHIAHSITIFEQTIVQPDLLAKNKLFFIKGKLNANYTTTCQIQGSDINDWDLKKNLHPIVFRFIEIVSFLCEKVEFFAAKIEQNCNKKGYSLSPIAKQILAGRW